MVDQTLELHVLSNCLTNFPGKRVLIQNIKTGFTFSKLFIEFL